MGGRAEGRRARARATAAGLLAIGAGLAAAAPGPAPDYEGGAYCRLDRGRGVYVTLLLSPPDAEGARRLRIEDDRPTDRAGAPVVRRARCTLEAGRLRCAWGPAGTLALEPGPFAPVGGHHAYVRVPGRFEDPPRLGPEPVTCFLKRDRPVE